MAIFRAETKSLSRGKGHNLVAAISYRAGIKLTDNNKINPNARSYDYTKKTDVVHRDIVLPKKLSAQLAASDIELDFQSIADLVEIGETTLRGKMKETARLAREWVLCGVPELTRAENIELFQQFAQQQSEEQGVLSMVFVHDPTAGDDMATVKAANGKSVKSSDPRNIHAHILLLTRKLEISADNSLSLGDKSDSELSNDERTRPIIANELVGSIDPQSGNKIQQGRGLCSNSDWLKNTRKQWADILNERLIENGVQPVTHQSYKELGVNFRPTRHLGKDASLLERMGIPTEFGRYNESINRDNRAHLEHTTNHLVTTAARTIDSSQQRVDTIIIERSRHSKLLQRIDHTKHGLAEGKRCIDSGKQGVAWANSANAGLDQIHQSNARNTDWANEQLERIHAVITTEEQPTKNTVEQERRVHSLITERTRRTTSIRPSPFDDNARRARAASRKQRLAELDEQSERFHYAAERSDRDITDHHYEDESANNAVRSIKIKLAMALLSRHHPNSSLQLKSETVDEHPNKFDERQIKSLDEFAAAIGAIRKTRDLRQDCWDSAPLFTAEVVEQHANIIQMLRNPAKEREQYNKSIPETPISSPQSDLKSVAIGNSQNDTIISNTATESISTSSRRYRP